MPVIDEAEIARYALEALGDPKSRTTGDKATTAVAIALAESGGNTTAVNHNRNGSVDRGLWQINSVHGIPAAELFDPAGNARAMARISKGGTDWSPWVVYKTGAYEAHLAAATVAVLAAGGNIGQKQAGPSDLPAFAAGVIGEATGTTALINAAVRFMSAVTSWEWWRRVFFVVLAIGLFFAAVALFVSDTRPRIPGA